MSPFLKLITVLGPPDWKDRYEDCGHRKQSPINIVKSETIKKSFSPLKITFDNARGLVTGTFKNTGHSPELEIADSNGASLTGGPLGDKTFELLQFHVHFGCANDRGSEHTLDEKRFSGEVSNKNHSKPFFVCLSVDVKFVSRPWTVCQGTNTPIKTIAQDTIAYLSDTRSWPRSLAPLFNCNYTDNK